MMKTSLIVYILLSTGAFLGIVQAQNATSSVRYIAKEMFDSLRSMQMDPPIQAAMTYVLPLSEDVVYAGMKQLLTYVNGAIPSDIKGYMCMATTAAKLAGPIIPDTPMGGHTTIRELCMNLITILDTICNSSPPQL